MAELPRSLPEFEAGFPDDAACARWLMEKRWPDGFRCPACGHAKAWELARERLTLQCAACERQVSVTAGTVLHGSHLPLRTWFLAAWLMATHANGISARQLWRQLGLGSYKSAWLLVRKLRRAMVDPEREPLAGLVEVDETSVPFRAKGEPVRPGRSHEGRLLIAGAVEIVGRGPGRVRLAVIVDYSAESLGGFVAGNVAGGSTVVSDGWAGSTGIARTSGTTRGSWARRRRTSSYPGCTGCSPTRSGGRWASTTACGRHTSRPTSTSSCSASTAAARPPPPSSACSASASPSSPPPTRS